MAAKNSRSSAAGFSAVAGVEAVGDDVVCAAKLRPANPKSPPTSRLGVPGIRLITPSLPRHALLLAPALCDAAFFGGSVFRVTPPSNSTRRFFGSRSHTNRYDSAINSSSSSSGTVFRPSRLTHCARAMYGAGMMPVRSHSSAKFSGVHLNERRGGTISMAATTNSLPSTLKHRSAPH